MKEKKRKRLIKLIITIAVVAAVAVAVIVTNIFIPLKYFTAYVHFNKDINARGNLRIRYVDVGFGDCAIVELPDGKTMLIDGGTGSYSNNYKIINLLNSSGIDRIDYLVCSSVNGEHCGGLSEIVKYKAVGTAYIPYVENLYLTDEYADFYYGLLNKGADVEISEYGVGVKGEGYWFSFLSPSVRLSGGSEYDIMNKEPTQFNINAASSILWLDCGGRGYAFLSDSTLSAQEKVAAQLILENKTVVLGGEGLTMSPCAMLKVSNHCAKNYSSFLLCDLLSPAAAIITVGENAQSCPSAEGIADIGLFVGDNIYRTDIHGTVTLTAGNEIVDIYKEK